MQTAVPTELCYSMTDPRMPMFAKPLGVAGDEMVADKVQALSSDVNWYRVIHQVGKNLPLTCIWYVPPSCQGSR